MFGINNPIIDPDLYDAEIAALTGVDQSVGATFLGIPLCDAVSVQQLCLQFVVNLLLLLNGIVRTQYFNTASDQMKIGRHGNCCQN